MYLKCFMSLKDVQTDRPWYLGSANSARPLDSSNVVDFSACFSRSRGGKWSGDGVKCENLKIRNM